jgi:spoIIIJ-associated protein
MTTGRKYFSGNTLEIALMQAARHHDIQPEEVAYRKIEKRHGFIKARKGVVIVVDPDSPRTAPAEAPSVKDKPVPVEEQIASAVMETADARTESSSFITEEEPSRAEEFSEPEPEPDVEPEVKAEVEADVEAEVQPEAREPEPDESPKPREGGFQAQEPTPDLMDAARRGLEELMGFAKLDLVVEVSEGEGQIEIELTGPDRDRLVEDRGNLLLAIQHLLPRLIRGYTGRSIPCHVDSEEFHAGREVELERLAKEAAEEVLDRQRPRTLPPMNPAERRIIHVTLVDNKDVLTESLGKGFFKRVTISPAMRRPRGFDRY